MSKKTALQKMCEKISDLHKDWDLGFSCSNHCSAELYCKQHYGERDETCAQALEEYYKQQADIPDGWDVVKELRQDVSFLMYASRDNSNFCEREHKIPEHYQGDWKSGQHYYQGKSHAAAEIIDFIDHKLQQAGIEVE